VVATPRVEESVGARLARGDVFCEVVDPELPRIEVSVREADVGLVKAGQAVKVKLHAFPTRSFRGIVERVGVAATVVDEERVFLVRARLDGAPLPLRSGMTGRAKIDTGPASLGRVLLRRPGRWAWGVLWGWL
jgi:HlyD family secretion protein